MVIKIAVVTVLVAAALLSACSFDANLAQITALGHSASITCYSGGKVIYSGQSSGKISSESGSDGWYFLESGTGNLIRVSGQCVIRNKT